ncbi:lipoamide acyltransferase component of branched-chain alpha-keto acid dehydrogenase complex [Tropilaelaps mercedesae]|uniref:Dihydrolipoamide acetyltransferase component of pyruvate dehydrogenase complex n=1 Tax=Tropilaelaps mercedesae TaxID=418985 RepID=A0A1V9XX22_9ACAR|nr:lipoamide acyltransferase component of branched-chain alpha-keto acid dehydrogenase complex [Tropilaelaps mercedesae]
MRKFHGTVLRRQDNSSGPGSVVSFDLSDIGEGISEVTVKEWFVKIGDRVTQFDPICEVQSDKASVTITSRYDGVIVKLHHEVNGLARVGSPLVDIRLDVAVEFSSSAPSKTAEPTTTAECNVSDSNAYRGAPEASVTLKGKVLATPAVRRMAGEMQIPLHEVTATGKGGRILKDDIFAYLDHTQQKQMNVPSSAQRGTSATSSALLSSAFSSTTAGQGNIDKVLPLQRLLEAKTVPISGYTRSMITTMTSSLEIPHFGYKDEIDLTMMMSVRKEMAEEASKYGVKLSYMPFFIKAASLALYEYPILNASLSPCKEQVIYKAEHNIGFAVDTPIGLIVPNIKNCQDKSVLEIGAELNRLQAAALGGRVAKEDLSKGTFSLSNIGSIGGTYAFPVIVKPNVCIGALGRIRKVPRYVGNDILPAHVLEVSWSADHRVIDGATMARFSNLWKRYLEKPHLLPMHLR